MRVLIAPDSFKGSLTATEVAHALAEGWRRVRPGDTVLRLPVADGGEGTLDALVSAWRGRFVYERVTGPLGDPVEARLGISRDGRRAVVEMAEASGLMLLAPEQRNPRRTTTRGTGELLRAALDLGVETVYVAVGGSATNDGGAGMAQALGVRFLDSSGTELAPGGEALQRLNRVDLTGLDERIRDVQIVVAADVDNPLTGPTGASGVFAHQKGANLADVAALDAGLNRYADVLEGRIGQLVGQLPGSNGLSKHTPGVGAAGGLAYGLAAFCGGEIHSGADLVLDAVDFDDRLSETDLVITGEGRLDDQTVHGKTPVAVARRARRFGRSVIAVAGMLGPGYEAVLKHGVTACMPIATGPVDERTSMAEAGPMLFACGKRLARLIGVGTSLAEQARNDFAKKDGETSARGKAR